MKLIPTLAVIIAALLAAPSASSARDSYRSSGGYCAPTLIRTCEIDRCCERHTAYDHCGNAYRYSVTVVTYRSHYSDGSSRTFTSSYRA